MSIDTPCAVSTGSSATANGCADVAEGGIGRGGAVHSQGAVVGALCHSRRSGAHGNHLVGGTGDVTGRVHVCFVNMDSGLMGEDLVLEDGMVGGRITVPFLKECHHVVNLVGSRELGLFC